jgi:hypothetical protein
MSCGAKGTGAQSLSAEDQLFILTQATLYLTATRGPASPEMRICYELAEPLCHSLKSSTAAVYDTHCVWTFYQRPGIYVALGATDMRKGYDGLYGPVGDKLGQDPATVFVR